MGQLVDIRKGTSHLNWTFATGSGGITGVGNNNIKPLVAGTGYKVVLTYFDIKNVSGVASEYNIRNGAGGTILFKGAAAASMKNVDTINFDPPLVTDLDTSLSFTMGTTATQTYVNATGYLIKDA